MHHPRRAAALLVVLTTLVVVMAATMMIARLAAIASLQRKAERSCHLGQDLIVALEPLMLHWLETQAPGVVLGPDVAAPEVTVLHDRWRDGQTTFDVRLTAWDQCGMLPWKAARRGSAILRSRLPVGASRLPSAERTPPGLDMLADEGTLLANGSPFPQPTRAADTRWFGDGADPGPARATPEPLAGVSSLGALVATHNPGLLNVQTAPLDLVEAALRQSGRGGIEQIAHAREEGRQVTVTELPVDGQGDQERELELVNESVAWAFRADVRAGAVSQSWWLVYVRGHGGGSQRRPSSSWKCAQRLAIPF